jgi:hypothetical protein
MSSIEHEPTELSRRGLIAGLGALAGVTAAATFPTVAMAAPHAASGDQTEALGAIKTNLTYLNIDAVAFHTGIYTVPNNRYSDDTSGTGVNSGVGTLSAPLLLPSGSVIRQLNIAYLGAPSVSIVKRPLASPVAVEQVLTPRILTSGNGAKTQTIELDPAVPLAEACTYSLRITSINPGDTVYGVTVGYEAPGRVFVPFGGAVPRVYDSRTIAAGKLAPAEERTISLGLAGARHGVFNLTLDATENAGFVAVFAANIVWPNNSSINWSSTNQIIANTVISNLDPSGQIKIRGGSNKTHVIIDMVGYLI